MSKKINIGKKCYTSEYLYSEVVKYPCNDTQIFSTSDYFYPEVIKFLSNETWNF